MDYFEHAGRLYETTTLSTSVGDDVMVELWDVSPGGAQLGQARLTADGRVAIHADGLDAPVLRWWCQAILDASGRDPS